MKKSYRPSREFQRMRYNSVLAGRYRRRMRGPRTVDGSPIRDNSEPFLANPNSAADAEYIIAKIEERARELRSLLPP